MAITAADIRDLVSREDDFGHEMRVGHVMRGHLSGRIEHGWTYVDPVSEKPRQFDFRWRFQKDNTVLHLAVECKNLNSEVPLVVCGRERVGPEAFHMLVESRSGTFSYRSAKGGIDRVVDGLSSITREARGHESFYPPGDFVGKNLIRIRPDKPEKGRYVVTSDADIYDKWSQALASAFDLTLAACNLSKSFGRSHVYSAILPIVVLPDEVLWTVTYDINGKIVGDASKTNGCQFYVGREVRFGETGFRQRFCFSHIHFFTLSGFALFLVEITQDTEAWQRLFNLKAEEIMP
jgi:hypothetical protein